jgi:cytoskeletal protein CcmA (bactofilin family)
MIWKRDEVADDETGDQRPPERRDERRHGREEQRMTDTNGEMTVIGQGAKLEGNIVSAGSLRIDGQVKGQINADGNVLLTQQSHVEADIRAKSVSVAGRFRGNISVSGKAELKRGGRIEGNINSKSLVIEEGGSFDGQSIMERQSAQAAATQHATSKQPAEARTEQVKVP